MTEFPSIPLTIEGSTVLHQVFQFDWKAWRSVPLPDRTRITEEISRALQQMERAVNHGSSQQSALYSVLGHKGDLMMIHFRDSVRDLNQLELTLAQTEFQAFLEESFSYLSIVELSLYESSMKTYEALAGTGIQQHTPEWKDAVGDVLQRQREAMAQRLFPSIPRAKHLCFYPMNRKRGEKHNWYTLSLEQRKRFMHDHGMIGRRYADRVRQVISGSIGLDDWEWAVDLFADDPLVFKQLIYEMRFDVASSLYADFGPFYVGIRLLPEELESWLGGKLDEHV